MKHLSAKVSLGLVVMLAACTNNQQASSSETPVPLPSVIVTRDDTGLPAGCRVREVADFTSRFFNARYRLLKIRVSGPGWHGGGDIVFLLTRQADDLDGGSPGQPILADGKGAINCKERAIFVWAMATGGGFGECPESAKIPANTVIACAR
jgi:hypothetical protein